MNVRIKLIFILLGTDFRKSLLTISGINTRGPQLHGRLLQFDGESCVVTGGPASYLFLCPHNRPASKVGSVLEHVESSAVRRE